MTGLPENLFANPVWHALGTRHRHFAISEGQARRYPSDVAPFVAVAEPGVEALDALHSLPFPGEQVWIADAKFPDWQGIQWETSLECLQMVLPEEVMPPEGADGIETLSCADAPAMVALTDLAFPGFFRVRTCEMGSYYGVRVGGELLSMSGERMMLDGYPEVSGVCTHPKHRGKRCCEPVQPADDCGDGRDYGGQRSEHWLRESYSPEPGVCSSLLQTRYFEESHSRP